MLVNFFLFGVCATVTYFSFFFRSFKGKMNLVTSFCLLILFVFNEIVFGYRLSYHVSDLNAGFNYGHFEENHGNAIEGGYHVALPNGGLQKVSYRVNKGEFN